MKYKCIKDLYKPSSESLYFKQGTNYEFSFYDKDFFWFLDEDGNKFNLSIRRGKHPYYFQDFFSKTAEVEEKYIPNVGDVVKLVAPNSFDKVVSLFLKSGLNSVEVPSGTLVEVLEVWHDYVRVKHGKMTKRWVDIGKVKKENENGND
jgi:hypothetical protein